MRQMWRVLGLILLSLAVVAGAPLPAGAAGKTVVVGITADAVILDPPQVLSASDRKYAMNMFDGLVEHELGSFKIAPVDTAPFAVAPRLAGSRPDTGTSSQRVPSIAGGVTRSCHIAGDCATKMAAPSVSEGDANNGVA